MTTTLSLLMLCICHAITLKLLRSHSDRISRLSDRCAWLSERVERLERRTS